MTWAGATGALVVAQTGGSDVRALDLDGSLRWSTTLDGAVTQLADLGGKGVAVMVRTGGTGALVLLDADTGAEQRRFELPGAVPFSAAPNGSSLAMVVGSRVHFYQLR
jgi:outer membrane protein assembly factor BamB